VRQQLEYMLKLKNKKKWRDPLVSLGNTNLDQRTLLVQVYLRKTKRGLLYLNFSPYWTSHDSYQPGLNVVSLLVLYIKNFKFELWINLIIILHGTDKPAEV
jgi:hypothetical protein